MLRVWHIIDITMGNRGKLNGRTYRYSRKKTYVLRRKMLRMAQKQNSEKCSNNAGNTQEMQCLEPTQINESLREN